ncbi:Fe-S oxidoreductase [Planctomycetales bacterium 10988]|nr:Fe-S oxidoreductase [Planctomycetales bacterium 10988]
MAPKITVVLSQGQSNSPVKRRFEEDLITAVMMEPNMEATVVPHLYDLKPDGTGMLCLKNLSGTFIIGSWLFPRAAHWILHRNGIEGKFGKSALVSDGEEEEETEQAPPPEESNSKRTIFHLNLKASKNVDDYLEEIRRIVKEASTPLVQLSLNDWIKGKPKPEQMDRYLNAEEPGKRNGNGKPASLPILGEVAAKNGTPPLTNGSEEASPETVEPIRIEEQTKRRWYPVIDFSRCTNCLECLDFCLFGVYGVDKVDSILVEQPDNCRKGCPACSRVCPENAIIFPQHKTPAIAGSPMGEAGGLKIDLSKLFGAPEGSALDTAVKERDRELMLDGREAVGATVGVPKRQENRQDEPKDELDDLIDELDSIDL